MYDNAVGLFVCVERRFGDIVKFYIFFFMYLFFLQFIAFYLTFPQTKYLCCTFE